MNLRKRGELSGEVGKKKYRVDHINPESQDQTGCQTLKDSEPSNIIISYVSSVLAISLTFFSLHFHCSIVSVTCFVLSLLYWTLLCIVQYYCSLFSDLEHVVPGMI